MLRCEILAQKVKNRKRKGRRSACLAQRSLKRELLLAIQVDDVNHYWVEYDSL